MGDVKAPRRGIALGQTALTTVEEIAAVAIADGFSVTVNGLIVHGKPSMKKCEHVGTTLRVAERSIQFAIGDWLNYVEGRFGEAASQLVDYSEGWSEKTCTVYRWLASRIAPDDRRMDRLTIRHHLTVAVFAPAIQRKWLTAAADDEAPEPWTVKRLIDAIKAGEDAPPMAWWLVVSCTNADDQIALQTMMEAQGRTCKPSVRRGRKAT